MIAETFGKRHDNVIRDIENLIEKDLLNFEEISIPDKYSRLRKAYEMDRDGFTILAMDFTGDKALGFKMRYIKAFNAMEAELMERQEKHMSQLEMVAYMAAQAVEQERKLVELDSDMQNTKIRVEAVEHKINTNGCAPGYIPIKDAHFNYGNMLSEAIFRDMTPGIDD